MSLPPKDTGYQDFLRYDSVRYRRHVVKSWKDHLTIYWRRQEAGAHELYRSRVIFYLGLYALILILRYRTNNAVARAPMGGFCMDPGSAGSSLVAGLLVRRFQWAPALHGLRQSAFS